MLEMLQVAAIILLMTFGAAAIIMGIIGVIYRIIKLSYNKSN